MPFILERCNSLQKMHVFITLKINVWLLLIYDTFMNSFKNNNYEKKKVIEIFN